MIHLGQMLIFCVLVLSSPDVFGKEFSGFRREPKTETMIYEGRLQRFFEEGPYFYLLIENHAAFYQFPKNSKTEVQVRTFLREKVIQKTEIKIEVDPITANIVHIKDKS